MVMAGETSTGTEARPQIVWGDQGEFVEGVDGKRPDLDDILATVIEVECDPARKTPDKMEAIRRALTWFAGLIVGTAEEYDRREKAEDPAQFSATEQSQGE